jgi:hypothetical protein
MFVYLCIALLLALSAYGLALRGPAPHSRIHAATLAVAVFLLCIVVFRVRLP